MEADGLFVYGTLREGGRFRTWLERTHPEGTTEAWMPGRLFHLPTVGYPAAVTGPEPPALPPGPGWIRGEFVGYEDDIDLLRALEDLDALEGVAEGLFLRRIVPVHLAHGGHRYQAWAWLFPNDRLPRLEREALELPDGDWSPYLQGR